MPDISSPIPPKVESRLDHVFPILRRVHMLVRADGLADRMSRYLIRRIEEHPKIVLHTCTEIVGLEGNGHLERVLWRNNQSGSVETHDIKHVFIMTGAKPNTGWLKRCVALDKKERSARDRLPSRSFIKCCTNKRDGDDG
jgi:thioredoxin reductase